MCCDCVEGTTFGSRRATSRAPSCSSICKIMTTHWCAPHTPRALFGPRIRPRAHALAFRSRPSAEARVCVGEISLIWPRSGAFAAHGLDFTLSPLVHTRAPPGHVVVGLHVRGHDLPQGAFLSRPRQLRPARQDCQGLGVRCLRCPPNTDPHHCSSNHCSPTVYTPHQPQPNHPHTLTQSTFTSHYSPGTFAKHPRQAP